MAELTEGLIGEADLTRAMDVGVADWVVSLEVGRARETRVPSAITPLFRCALWSSGDSVPTIHTWQLASALPLMIECLRTYARD